MTALPPDVVADLRQENARLQAENARLFNETEHALARQTATSDILRVISQSPTDVQPVFDTIVLTAARLLRCDRAFIQRCEAGSYWTVASAGLEGPRPITQSSKAPIDPEANFPSRAILAKKTLHLPDWSAIELPEFERYIRELHGINSALYMPLLREGECIGLLAMTGTEAGMFGEAEIALAESFRDQAVIAIENTRLFNETKEALERQTATADILKVIASSPSDVQPVFEAIAASANRLIVGFSATVMLFVGDVLQLVAFTPTTPTADEMLQASFPRPLAEFPPFELVRDGETVQFPDTESEVVPPMNRTLARSRGYRGMLFTPLMSKGAAIGILSVTRKEPGAFAAHHVQLLQTFADQAVIAIENARLFHETQEALERQTATADILKVIASSPDDVQPVFDAIVNSAAKLFEPCSATITTLKDGRLHWNAVAQLVPSFDHKAAEATYPIPFDPDRSPSARAILERRIIQIPDIKAADTPEFTQRAAAAGGFRNIIFVPLISENNGIGTIILTHPQAGFKFSDRQLALLQTFADQAVIAIENVRLFNETQEALERQTATADILKVIASSPDDVQPVFEAIAASANRLIGGFSTAVHRVIDDVVHLVAFTPTNPESDEALKAAFPFPRNEIAAVAMVQNGETAQVADAEAADPQTRRLGRARGWRSVTFTPLMSQGAFIGFIACTRRETGVLGDHHVQLLRTFADQAVIAIQNVRLFNETREALERQTATADILKVIASSPNDVQPVFDVIVERAVRLCGARMGRVYRYDDGMIHMVAGHGLSVPGLSTVQQVFPRPAADDTIAGRAIHSGQPYFVTDVERDETVPPLSRQMIEALGTRSQVTVPMLRSGEPIGAITVGWAEPAAYGDQQVALLQTFADQAVIAIENVRLFNETQEALERQTATADILKVIASSPSDVQPVFEAIAASANRLIGGFSTAVFRFVDEVAHLAAFTPTDPAADQTLTARFPRPLAEFRPFELVHGGEAAQIADTETSGVWFKDIARARGFRSMLFSPLVSKAIPIGLISVTRMEPGSFADHHVQLLQTFADQAVIAIENVRLFNETKEALERQTATADILKVIASSPSDVQPVFEAIATSANRLIGGFSSTVFRFIDGVAHLKAFTPTTPAADEVLQATFPRPVADFPPFKMAQAGEVTQIPDTEALSDELLDIARARGYRSMLFTPLMNDGVSIGFITVTRVQPGAFADHHVQLLRTFADQAVIAIENVRLFDEVQAKTRDLTEALTYQTGSSNILKVIASSPTDVQPVLKAIVESACELCEADDAVVHLREGDDLRSCAHHGPIPVGMDRRPINRNFASGRAAVDKVAIHLHDVLSSEGDDLPEGQEMSRRVGIRTVLSVPLLRENESIGTILLRRTEVKPFSDKQIALLQTFADQAVIAIGNVRLFDEVQARTEDLRESLQQQTATADVLKVISRSVFDLQTVLDTLVESAYTLCGAKLGLLYLQGEEAYECKAIAGAGVAEASLLFKGRPIRAGRGTAAERVILTGEVQGITDFFEDPDFDPKVRETIRNAGDSDSSVGQLRSTLAVPMTRDDAVIGVLVIGRSQTGPFPPRQIELLQTFADQAVIAIENARLFDEVQAKTRDLTEALTYQTGSSNILRVIASSPTDVGPVLEAIVESACELCEADDAVVQLREGDELRFAAHRGSIPVGLQRRTINPNFIGGRAVVDRVTVHLRDVLSAEGDEFPESREISRPLGTRTLLCVPLLGEGDSIGLILLRRTEVKPFSDKQIALLQTFADQAVIAIGNVRLFDEVQAKTRDLTEALTYQTGSSNILRVIASSPTDVGPVLKAIVESACELCEADDALATLRDGEDLVFMAQHGSIPVTWQRMPVNRQWASGRAVVDRKPVHVRDLLANEGEPFPDSQEMARQTDVRTVLSVPLLRENQSIGAIVLRRTEVQPFSDKQIALLQTFADQAVIAIGNVRLFDEVQARTRELSKSLDDLRTAQDRLVQTEKLASLGQLTAGIAHEIKNPLNFVNNFASLSAELTDELNEVLAPAPLDDKTREEVDEITHTLKDNLQKVVQHGKRADSIVKNMLLHSREGSGEHRPADINAILDESLNLAYHGARAEKREFNVTLQRDFDEMAGTIEVFPQEITRVFLNLISNGFYAVTKRKTENGGSVFEPTIRATTRSLGDAVEIRIRDNGTGIPAEVKEKMFNPFFTTKPAGEGTGLGLSMSHDIIVKQHGGRIEVETEPGEFTEFRIVLPRTKNPSDKNRGQS